jgi:hypothetical protein
MGVSMQEHYLHNISENTLEAKGEARMIYEQLNEVIRLLTVIAMTQAPQGQPPHTSAKHEIL